jgi:hypothetical protein
MAEMRAMQMQQAQMQMAQQKQQMAAEDQMNAKMQQMATLGQQLQQGQGQGVLRPEISQQAQDFINTKAGYLAGQGVRMTPAQMVDLAKNDENARSREAIAASKAAGGPIELGQFKQDVGDKTIEIAIDKRTGREIGRGTINKPPRAYPTPEEAGDTERAKTYGSETAKMTAAKIKEIKDSAAGAPATLARINEVEALYNRGQKTGPGQEILNELTGIGVRLGIYPEGDQADKEKLQMLLSMDALEKAKALYKGQGSVTKDERARIDTVSAGIGKTQGANVAAFAMARALATRAMELERVRRELHDKKTPPEDIAEAVDRWVIDNPLPEFNAPKKGAAAAPAPKLPSGWSVK